MDFFRVILKSPIIEKLLCYAINPQESQKIDPSSDCYLFSNPESINKLSAGTYFITQIKKERLKDNELLELAIELQKEALWRRLKPENSLIMRVFFEDNKPITQLWRPLLTS